MDIKPPSYDEVCNKENNIICKNIDIYDLRDIIPYFRDTCLCYKCNKRKPYILFLYGDNFDNDYERSTFIITSETFKDNLICFECYGSKNILNFYSKCPILNMFQFCSLCKKKYIIILFCKYININQYHQYDKCNIMLSYNNNCMFCVNGLNISNDTDEIKKLVLKYIEGILM